MHSTKFTSLLNSKLNLSVQKKDPKEFLKKWENGSEENRHSPERVSNSETHG
jgi:hypothetical protein